MTAPHNDSTRSGDTTRDKRAATRQTCSYCFTYPNAGEVACPTTEQALQCAWMNDAARKDLVEWEAEKKSKQVEAAAQDMLALLQDIVEPTGRDVVDVLKEIRTKARAAIAKATEPPHG